MKKLLTRTGILIALLLPSVAFGAYNDVTLTTDTVISVNGVTMNVSGSSATMETLTVGSTNFSVNVLSGSTLTGTAASQKVMSISTEPYRRFGRRRRRRRFCNTRVHSRDDAYFDPGDSRVGTHHNAGGSHSLPALIL